MMHVHDSDTKLSVVIAMDEAISAFGSCTVTIEAGKDRSSQQNRISHAWYSEISRKTGEDTPEGIKTHCKAYFGIPILMAENPRFAETYSRTIRKLANHEDRMQAISLIDVTSLLTTEQMSRYLENVQKHYADRNTDPVMLLFPGDAK